MGICPAEAIQDTITCLKKNPSSFFASPQHHSFIRSENSPNHQITLTWFQLASCHQQLSIFTMEGNYKTTTTVSEGFSSCEVSPGICLVEAYTVTATKLKYFPTIFCKPPQCFVATSNGTRKLRGRREAANCSLIGTSTCPAKQFINQPSSFNKNPADRYTSMESYPFSKVSYTCICPVEAHADTAALENSPLLAVPEQCSSNSRRDSDITKRNLPTNTAKNTALLYHEASTANPSIMPSEFRLLSSTNLRIQPIHSQVSQNNNTADCYIKWYGYHTAALTSLDRACAIRINISDWERTQGGTPKSLG